MQCYIRYNLYKFLCSYVNIHTTYAHNTHNTPLPLPIYIYTYIHIYKDEDTGSRDLSDLTEEQRKVLYDWEKRFVAVKKYPIVALLEQE